MTTKPIPPKNPVELAQLMAELELGTPKTQAERIIDLFKGLRIEGKKITSGEAALAAAIQAVGGPYKRQAIYQWRWRREKHGRGGLIPTRAVPWIEKAARAFGIMIPDGYLDVRVQNVEAYEKTDRFFPIPIRDQAQKTLETYQRPNSKGLAIKRRKKRKKLSTDEPKTKDDESWNSTAQDLLS